VLLVLVPPVVEVLEMLLVLMKGSVTTFNPESPQPTNKNLLSGLTIRDNTGYATET